MPSYKFVYALSVNSGVVEDTIPVEHLIAYFDKYILRANTLGTAIEIVDLDQQVVISDIELTDIAPLQRAFGLLWRNTDREGNTLIFYYAAGREPPRSPRVDAFDALTGKQKWSIDYPFIGIPVVSNGRLVMYSIEGLRIYDTENGELLNTVNLSREGEPYKPKNVWLSGYADTILISYRDTHELIALRLEK